MHNCDRLKHFGTGVIVSQTWTRGHILSLADECAWTAYKLNDGVIYDTSVEYDAANCVLFNKTFISNKRRFNTLSNK